MMRSDDGIGSYKLKGTLHAAAMSDTSSRHYEGAFYGARKTTEKDDSHYL